MEQCDTAHAALSGRHGSVSQTLPCNSACHTKTDLTTGYCDEKMPTLNKTAGMRQTNSVSKYLINREKILVIIEYCPNFSRTNGWILGLQNQISEQDYRNINRL